MGARTRAGTSPLTDLELPERYEFLRRIASGGMGSVWWARDEVLGRHVAIKLLGERFLQDESAIRRFQREARAAARLSGHSHVVTIYDVGQTEPSHGTRAQPFIVMEYMAGGSVADALRVDAISQEDAVRWIRQAASAVDHGHELGIVHRDIKPANLLLDGNRELHVADFGIASIGTEETITGSGQLFGTAAYISPEQALGGPASAASDRYALAVAAFELLAGERPFVAQHFAAQARQHIEVEPPRASAINPKLPRAVDAVLRRGMAKQPADRWSSAGAFAEALAGALADDPGAATMPTVVGPGRAAAGAGQRAGPVFAAPAIATSGRRPRVLVLSALAATAFALGAAIGAGGSGQAGRTRVSADLRRTAPVRTATRGTPPKPPTRTTATHPAAAPTVPALVATTPPTADALQARGHQLLLAGAYSSALPVLRQALAAASPSSLTFAYTLFDLGRALRLSGDPQAAVQVLRQRLQIPNQTGVVRQELALAEAAAAGGSSQAPSAGPSRGAAPTRGGRGGPHSGSGGSRGGD